MFWQFKFAASSLNTILDKEVGDWVAFVHSMSIDIGYFMLKTKKILFISLLAPVLCLKSCLLQDFTLEELLDDEEILQECKTKNARLIELFVDAEMLILYSNITLCSLSKEEIFNKLIGFVVDEPDVALPEKQRFKFACHFGFFVRRY